MQQAGSARILSCTGATMQIIVDVLNSYLDAMHCGAG